MSAKPFLSVIVPVFNEEKRIHNLITISSYLKKSHFVSEIIVVNDGSTDKTLNKLKVLKKKLKLKILDNKKNKGKGYAIKKGVLEAAGKFILFCDVDLSTPIQELDKFLHHIKTADLIIATRRNKQSKLIARQSLLRENLGRAFTFLSKLMLNLNVSDFTCGFKLFSQKSAKEIFSRLTINRWGFDSELLFISKKRGFQIKEIGVTWYNNSLSKVKFPEDIFMSLLELLKVRINNLKGVYD